MARRPRLAAARWQELIERQRGSGLGVEAFCRRHRVAVSTFFAWRRRLWPTSRPAFVEVTSAVDAQAGTTREVLPIDVVLQAGVVLRVPCGFDATTLRRVVEVLS